MAGVEEVAQHAVEVEIDKPGLLVQQERFEHQHFFEGNQALLQLRQQALALRLPLAEAAAAELAFFVAQEAKLFGNRHELPPVDVVELEANTFNLILNIPPEKGLHTLHLPREQAKLKFRVQILGNDLGILADLKDNGLAVADDRNPIIALSAQTPDQ